MDSLAALVIIVAGALCVFWSIRSLAMQFTVSQFMFIGTFCVLIGVFIESYIAGTKELVLSTVGLLFLMAGWVLMRARNISKNHLRRRAGQ